MTPAYDPRRSRPRPAAVPDPEAAPIDALLGPEPEPTDPEVSPAGSSSSGEPPRAAPPATPTPDRPPPRAGAPSFLVQLAPLLVLGAVLAAVVWWLTHRRER
jgi:hypothetical protein